MLLLKLILFSASGSLGITSEWNDVFSTVLRLLISLHQQHILWLGRSASWQHIATLGSSSSCPLRVSCMTSYIWPMYRLTVNFNIGCIHFVNKALKKCCLSIWIKSNVWITHYRITGFCGQVFLYVACYCMLHARLRVYNIATMASGQKILFEVYLLTPHH